MHFIQLMKVDVTEWSQWDLQLLQSDQGDTQLLQSGLERGVCMAKWWGYSFGVFYGQFNLSVSSICMLDFKAKTSSKSCLNAIFDS